MVYLTTIFIIFSLLSLCRAINIESCGNEKICDRTYLAALKDVIWRVSDWSAEDDDGLRLDGNTVVVTKPGKFFAYSQVTFYRRGGACPNMTATSSLSMKNRGSLVDRHNRSRSLPVVRWKG